MSVLRLGRWLASTASRSSRRRRRRAWASTMRSTRWCARSARTSSTAKRRTAGSARTGVSSAAFCKRCRQAANYTIGPAAPPPRIAQTGRWMTHNTHTETHTHAHTRTQRTQTDRLNTHKNSHTHTHTAGLSARAFESVCVGSSHAYNRQPRPTQHTTGILYNV